MKICPVTVIFITGLITASCSDKTGLDSAQNSQAEQAKPSDAGVAVNAKPTTESEVERSTTSESESAQAEGETELQPPEEEIGEDCVAFLRSTKTVPGNGEKKAGCPECPVNEAKEVLKFDHVRVDRVVRSESTCEVNVTIYATFNPSTREDIAGGLTAWISPEQKARYLQGETPSEQQIYHVKVLYRRHQAGWRPVEFDRP